VLGKIEIEKKLDLLSEFYVDLTRTLPSTEAIRSLNLRQVDEKITPVMYSNVQKIGKIFVYAR
jgi:hypothetical protein